LGHVIFARSTLLSEAFDTEGRRRAFVLPGRSPLTESTLEKIRTRTVRSKIQSLKILVRPLRSLLFLAAIAALAWFAVVQMKHLFFGTSYFELKQVEVEGLVSLRREAVLNLGKVAPAMNILALDKEAIRQRLLAHPLIKEARVELDGLYTLRLRILERLSLMYVKAGTTFMELADDGVILAADGLGERDLPIVTGVRTDGLKVGDSLTGNDAFFEARAWVNTLGPDILKNISELNFANIQNPYLFLLSGEKVIPKSLEDFKARYLFLCALLDNLKRNNVEPDCLDMRAPNEIVVKPKRARRAQEGSMRHVHGG